MPIVLCVQDILSVLQFEAARGVRRGKSTLQSTPVYRILPLHLQQLDLNGLSHYSIEGSSAELCYATTFGRGGVFGPLRPIPGYQP